MAENEEIFVTDERLTATERHSKDARVLNTRYTSGGASGSASVTACMRGNRHATGSYICAKEQALP